MGIPMYGWRADGEAMTGDALVQWLEAGGDKSSVRWDAEAQEHLFSAPVAVGASEESIGEMVMSSSYPTRDFICARLRLAEELHLAGVALWEIGQPLPMLMDTI